MNWWDRNNETIIMWALGAIAVAVCVGLILLAGGNGNDGAGSPY